MSSETSFDAADLVERATAVLKLNDLGGWTKAAPRLYPHQWSWDSAFVAIGHIPGSELVRGQVELHDNGYVKVAEPSTRTNLAGVFAVGDLVDFTYRQAVTAAGSGTRGALDAEWYLRDTPPTDEERIEAAEETRVAG